ncbi:MAG: hypothetical protein WCI92_09630 [Bacteroidota bacterium]
MSKDSSDQAFEKYKYRIDLFKWLIGSVALVIMTTIIDWGFKDRAAGLQEVQQYDKYATELIVLNNDPVKKRMLAQFFSKVTPSGKLREGWEKYYDEVNIEYRKFLEKDSLNQLKLNKLMDQDSASLTKSQKKERDDLQIQVRETQRILTQPLLLPNSSVIPVVYIQIGSEAQRNTAKQLIDKINEIGFKAPGIELVESASKMPANEIRYFRETDETFAKALQALLQNQNIEAILKPIFSYGNKTKEGTIELWLK